MKDFFRKLVVEGGRVFWTAVEATAGFLGAYAIPNTLFDFAGPYEPAVVAAVGVGIASVTAALKEAVRKHQAGPVERAAVEVKS